jgi:hypothetical protein
MYHMVPYPKSRYIFAVSNKCSYCKDSTSGSIVPTYRALGMVYELFHTHDSSQHIERMRTKVFITYTPYFLSHTPIYKQ